MISETLYCFQQGPIAPSRCLGIFGLNERTTERDIEKMFGSYPGYSNCRLITDYISNRNRGFGFMNFDTVEDATYVCTVHSFWNYSLKLHLHALFISQVRDKCNGKEIQGRVVRIEYSLSQRATTPTPGMYFGVRARYVPTFSTLSLLYQMHNYYWPNFYFYFDSSG